MKKELSIYIKSWLLGLGVLLTLACVGWLVLDTRSHFKQVDAVTLYERQQIARYSFENASDRRYFKWAAFFDLEAAMVHAEVLEETSEQVQSDYLTPVSQPDMTQLTYAPKAGEVVTVKGLRIPMTGHENDLVLPIGPVRFTTFTQASYSFNLVPEKPQAVAFVAQLKQTSYRYDDGRKVFNFQVLAYDNDKSYLSLVDVAPDTDK